MLVVYGNKCWVYMGKCLLVDFDGNELTLPEGTELVPYAFKVGEELRYQHMLVKVVAIIEHGLRLVLRDTKGTMHLVLADSKDIAWECHQAGLLNGHKVTLDLNPRDGVVDVTFVKPVDLLGVQVQRGTARTTDLKRAVPTCH